MNPQWSDEVKERYTKDQAFYAECSARGIQICQDTATVKLAIRNKPWVGLTDEDVAVVLTGDASLATRLDELTPSWIELTRAIEAKLKEKNT